MYIAGLGNLTKDEQYTDLYHSTALPLNVLGGQTCIITVTGYEQDASKEAFHQAIENFLSADESVLQEATPFVFQYYQDMNSNWDVDDEEYIQIDSPQDVWRHIQLGTEATVSRRPNGDKKVYISLNCECDWEPEHGLQIVFREGLAINKVGQCDGHLTNSNAYAQAALENVIYKSPY